MEEVVKLENTLFPDNNLNETTIATLLSNDHSLIATADNLPVGYLVGYVATWDLLDVIRLGVVQDFRGRGIAKALLSKAMESGSNRRTMLSVRKDNQIAIRLYKSCGFEIVGTYYTSWLMVTSY